MSRRAILPTACVLLASLTRASDAQRAYNPWIDMEGHLEVSAEAARHREGHLVSEDEFIRMSREEGTIVLDARSKDKFEELHVRGAILLSYPDITIEALARTIPDKDTRILIYCNNNFRGDESAFPAKVALSALNLVTYAALYGYGYRNVYELGTLLDVGKSRIELVSSPGAPSPR